MARQAFPAGHRRLRAPRRVRRDRRFDLGAEPHCAPVILPSGAVANFLVGTVRDRNDGQIISAMELEPLPRHDRKAIEAMIG